VTGVTRQLELELMLPSSPSAISGECEHPIQWWVVGLRRLLDNRWPGAPSVPGAGDLTCADYQKLTSATLSSSPTAGSAEAEQAQSPEIPLITRRSGGGRRLSERR
jgi:hypothetical protein